MNSNDESALNSFSMMSHVNVNIGGCVCVSGCLKCIYEKDLEKKKSKTCEDGFGYLVNLTAVMSVISSLRKKMLSYISSVHLWPADQSMRDFWVRGFWKNLPLGINPEHSCVSKPKSKMFSSTCILTLKVPHHVYIFIMTCWLYPWHFMYQLLHLQVVFLKKMYTSTH